MDAPVESDAVPDRINGVYVSNIEKLLTVLQLRVLKVLDAHRFFEEHTRMRNRIGSNNLTEALSHMGRIAESAHEMTEEQQREQITHLEDHLRRTMMESFELVARARLGRLRKDGIVERYQTQVVPLALRGKLPNIKPLEEIEALERDTRHWMEEGRKRKHHHRWEDWDHGAECLAKACESANELDSEMRKSVGAAQDYRRNQLFMWLAVLALILAAAGIGVAFALA